MTVHSEYKPYAMAANFFWSMEPDRWYSLDEITFQQVSWGAKIVMTPEERDVLVEVGKWMIGYGMLDSQSMELTFNNDYTRVKKSPWNFNFGDSLYGKIKRKQKKDESDKKRKLEAGAEGEGNLLAQIADHAPAETKREGSGVIP